MSIFSNITDEIKSWFQFSISKFGFSRLDNEDVDQAVRDYIQKNPEWVEFAVINDPALREKTDVNQVRGSALDELSTYLGLQAVALHEKAHALYTENPSEARRLSQQARLATGIEIHPGAKLGQNVFIDHGAGVVIGETAKIGNNVAIYHGVTLGGHGRALKDGGRRHPIIGDNVTLNVGATLLGPITVGKKSLIDANVTMKGDIQVGNNVKIGAGAEILGNVTIEDGARIGEGAIIIGDAVIHKGATVAPGVSVRQHDVEAGHTADTNLNPVNQHSQRNEEEFLAKPDHTLIDYAKVIKHHEPALTQAV